MYYRSRIATDRQGFFLTIAILGLTEISCQIIILLLYQTCYGTVYSHLGMLIGGYMLGLALASVGQHCNLLGTGAYADHAILMRHGRSLQAGMVLLPLLLAGLALSANTLSRHNLLFSSLLFVLTVAFGIIGGAQFITLNASYLSRYPNRNGTLYAADLLGSGCGTLLIVACVLPVCGIVRTSLFLALLNTGTLAMLLLKRK
jgi:hypothetical protein